MSEILPGYEPEYREKVKTLDVMYYTFCEEVQGHMAGKSHKEVIDYFERLKPCICGGAPKIAEIEGMGELDTIISCKSCDRSICQTMYDRENDDDPECDELALIKWNAGMLQEDIDRIKKEKWERKRLHETDLDWYPVHPNNMPNNGIAGLYCLIFKQTECGIYCCKWTIEYQRKEIKPMMLSDDSPIEAYILHMKRYFDVKGELRYPKPSNQALNDMIFSKNMGDSQTLCSEDVNDYGDFERAYLTLEDAKAGALARCGWQGLNRETILKV